VKLTTTTTSNNNNADSDETVEHTITACPILAREQYIKIYDRVCAQLQFNIYKEKGVTLDSEHWCAYVPKSVETSHEGKVTKLWNHKCELTEP